jgi:hypothetical protein
MDRGWSQIGLRNIPNGVPSGLLQELCTTSNTLYSNQQSLFPLTLSFINMTITIRSLVFF